MRREIKIRFKGTVSWVERVTLEPSMMPKLDSLASLLFNSAPWHLHVTSAEKSRSKLTHQKYKFLVPRTHPSDLPHPSLQLNDIRL